MAQPSAKKLEHTRPAEKESGPSATEREQLTKMPEPPFAKRKRNKAICPEYQIMGGGRESRYVRAAPWQEGGDQSESMERKGWTPP